MISVSKITPAIGAEISDVDFSRAIPPESHDAIYQALLDHLVIFFRGTEISSAAHLSFAKDFGELDDPHPIYPHVDGFENIVLLENDSGAPPDTNSWHTDLTFKAEQPLPRSSSLAKSRRSVAIPCGPAAMRRMIGCRTA